MALHIVFYAVDRSDECASSPCMFGRCLDQLQSFRCNCTNTGYSGVLCDQGISNVTSKSIFGYKHRKIADVLTTTHKRIHYADKRHLILLDIDECSTSTHECRRGTCVNTPGGYTCQCDEEYTGEFCQTCLYYKIR